MLFRVFNMYVFGDFPVILLLLVSSLMLLLSKNRYCVICTLLNLRCVLWLNMFYLSEWSVWACQESLFPSFWIKQSADVNSIQLIHGALEFNYALIDFLPAGSVCFWEKGVEVSNYFRDVGSSLSFCSSISFYPIVCHSVVRHIHIKNSCLLAELTPLYLCNIYLCPW